MILKLNNPAEILYMNVHTCDAVLEHPDTWILCTKTPGHDGPHHGLVAWEQEQPYQPEECNEPECVRPQNHNGRHAKVDWW